MDGIITTDFKEFHSYIVALPFILFIVQLVYIQQGE